MTDISLKTIGCIKILKLQFLVGAIKQQEELFKGKDQLLVQYQKGNLAVVILIDKTIELLGHGKEFSDPSENDFFERFHNLIESTFKHYYETKQVPRFEPVDLPPFLFLNWRHVVRSIRAQVIKDKYTEELSFMNFLGYQFRIIEDFVNERSK
jgi:hypothetical protein